MKLVGALLSGLLLGGTLPCHAQGPAPGESAISQARKAAERWLALVDASQYEASWDSSAAVFRAAVTRPEWQSSLLKARAPFGAVQNRTFVGADYRTSLPGVPAGEYVVIQYAAELVGNRSIVETVTPMRESDGRWRVSGYYIRPQ